MVSTFSLDEARLNKLLPIVAKLTKLHGERLKKKA